MKQRNKELENLMSKTAGDCGCSSMMDSDGDYDNSPKDEGMEPGEMMEHSEMMERDDD